MLQCARKSSKLSAILSAIILSCSPLRAQLNVYFVNVGQGDAIYIEFPNGTNALIDGGPSAAPIYNFLREKGVTKLDRVVLTHPHSDHYRGLKKVFTAFDVRNYYDTKAENVDAVGDNNLRELAALEPGCVTRYPIPGSELPWDPKVTVKVLNACYKPVQMHDNDENNNCSLVLRLYYNGTGVMLMGDAEASVEDWMARTFKSGLRSYALKVAHHGSRFSSTGQFLARTQPEIAVISVGVNNVYGHPHIETIDRLRAVGAKIFYTTSGSYWLNIPAQRYGVPPVLTDPVLFGPASPARDELDPLIYSPSPQEMGSAALEELKAQAAAQ